MTDPAAVPRSAVPVRALMHLGRIPVHTFLARHWQRRPLVIRQALPGFELPFTPAQLFELSTRDEVESRLIERVGSRWRLRHGPFRPTRIPSRKRSGWTLLVQGVDLQLEAAADLLARFRFLPDARLDDLMVSYASDGGGVGPHIDSYDVFLLQALGQRRWRIERRPDPTCVPDLPLQQLARFRPQHEWVLEPGDMLYLPPGVAHEGVAVGECVTCSIGFRTPSWGELAAIWSELQSAQSHARSGVSRDAGLTASAHPARLPARMIEQAHRQLLLRQPARQDVALALLRQLSEPKARVTFEPPVRPMTPARFADAVRLRGLHADRRTRMLYSDQTLGINGELVPLPDPAERRLIRSLADRRALPAPFDAQPGGALSAAMLTRLYQWYRAGWVRPISSAPSADDS
jgi:50S ribosomal protein L16 3-hydroxylase